MTLIPADTKDLKGSLIDAPPAPTLENKHQHQPSPIHDDTIPPPPEYSETDPSIAGTSSRSRSVTLAPFESGLPTFAASSSSAPTTPLTPGYHAPLSPPEKIPESDAVKSSRAVNLTGPLRILGSVKSSGSVTLCHDIIPIHGRVSSSSWILLERNVYVDDKVDASGSVKLKSNVYVGGKVDASGSIEIFDGVTVGEKVDASGSVTLDGGERGIRVEGSVKSSGKVAVKGWVEIGGNVDCSGKCLVRGYGGRMMVIRGRIKSSGAVMVEGDVFINRFVVTNSVTIDGKLHVLDDFEVKGNVNLTKGSELVVDGKRTVQGSIVQKS